MMLNVADYFESAENRAPFIEAFGSEIIGPDGSSFDGIVDRVYTQDNDRSSFRTRWELRAGSDDVDHLESGQDITYKGDLFKLTSGPLPDDVVGWTKFYLTKKIL